MSRRTQVLLADTPPSGAAPVSTGRVYLAAITNKGVFDPLKPCRSMTDVQKRFGTRQTFSTFWDWCETFFREGGAEVFPLPVRGPAPVKATLNIAGTGTTLIATALSAGDWANGATGGYTVEVINGPVGGASFRQLIVRFGGVEVGRTIEFNDRTQVDGAIVDEVQITLGGGSGLPTVAAAANLASGTLDRLNITQTQIDAAINTPAADLGPGQVVACDWQTAATHATMRAHAKLNDRWALEDTVDTTTKATLLGAAAAEQGATDGLYGELLGVWATIRGTAGVTSRSVPPSAFRAAKIAQTDVTAGPNQAASGAVYGAQTSSLITGVKASFSDADQAELEDAGVNLLISRYGQVLCDGNRSLVEPLGSDNEWLQASNCRLRMAIVAQLQAAGQQFEHVQLTRPHIAEYDTALTGVMQGFQDQLFAADDGSDPGFVVETGPGVNTAETIAARQLLAQVGFRPAKGADLVTITLSVVGIGDPIS